MAKADAVALIQRFRSALNLDIHFHMLFLDGVYIENPQGSVRFRWVKVATSAELTQLEGIDALVAHLAEYQAVGLQAVSLRIYSDPAASIKLIGERVIPALMASSHH